MDINMMMQLFAYALGIVLTAGTLYIGKQYLIPWLKAKLGNEQYDLLIKNLKDLIVVAEQHFGPKTGAEKKAWVIEELKKTGIEFDENFVSNLIDGMVFVLQVDGLVNTNKENE